MFEGFETASMIMALLLLSYIWYVTVTRLMGDSDDPAASISAGSDTGSFTFLLSGAWLIGAIAAIVTALTWPVAVERGWVGVMLVGVVLANIIFERGERS